MLGGVLGRVSGGVSGGVIGRHSTRLVSFVQRTSRKLGGVLLNFGKSAAYQQYGYGIPLVRLLTTAAVITYQTGMLQEPSFLGTNIMLVLGKLYVSTVGTTLHIATVHPKALPGSPKGTSSPAYSVRTTHLLRPDEAGSAFGWVHSVPSTVIVHHNFQRIEELFSL